jgi:predicted transcriptional regulator
MRRSNLEIYTEILKILSTKKALNVTSILRKANINFNQSKDYFVFLLENGLISKVNIKREVVYFITPKGMLLLKALVKIEGTLKLEESFETGLKP